MLVKSLPDNKEYLWMADLGMLVLLSSLGRRKKLQIIDGLKIQKTPVPLE